MGAFRLQLARSAAWAPQRGELARVASEIGSVSVSAVTPAEDALTSTDGVPQSVRWRALAPESSARDWMPQGPSP
jgi:hypothetical protein